MKKRLCLHLFIFVLSSLIFKKNCAYEASRNQTMVVCDLSINFGSGGSGCCGKNNRQKRKIYSSKSSSHQNPREIPLAHSFTQVMSEFIIIHIAMLTFIPLRRSQTPDMKIIVANSVSYLTFSLNFLKLIINLNLSMFRTCACLM